MERGGGRGRGLAAVLARATEEQRRVRRELAGADERLGRRRLARPRDRRLALTRAAEVPARSRRVRPRTSRLRARRAHPAPRCTSPGRRSVAAPRPFRDDDSVSALVQLTSRAHGWSGRTPYRDLDGGRRATLRSRSAARSARRRSRPSYGGAWAGRSRSASSRTQYAVADGWARSGARRAGGAGLAADSARSSKELRSTSTLAERSTTSRDDARAVRSHEPCPA